jgi:hypothetical protein
MPVVRSSEFASGIATELFVALNSSALPQRLVVVQIAPVMLPLFPAPARSVTIEPVFSLKS